MAARLAAALGIFIALWGALLRERAVQPPFAPPTPHTAGAPWIIDVVEGRATVDLDFSQFDCAKIIIGSLGEAERQFHITLETQPHGGTGTLPGLTLDAWQPRLHKVEQPAIAPAASGNSNSSPSLTSCDRTLTSCTGEDSSPQRSPGARRFYLYVGRGSLENRDAYIPVFGRLCAEGQWARVYIDEHAPSDAYPAELPATLVRLLDEQVIPRCRALLGLHQDIDGDGKLALLLTPLVGQLHGGTSAPHGFVRGDDFRFNLEAPFSNHADVIYLHPRLNSNAALQSLLAHEYSHAVCFSQRMPGVVAPAGLPDEEDWLNEAIAHVVEMLDGGDDWNLAERIEVFLKNSHAAPLVVRDYYRAGLWRDPGCRGATYLFLQWCVDQYGPQLLRELARAPFQGRANLEWTTGRRFEELFRRWTVSLAGHSPSSITRGALPIEGAQRPRSRGGLTIVGPSWNVDESPCTVELRGTAATCVTVHGPCAGGDDSGVHSAVHRGVRRLVLRGPAAARLQVTLIEGEKPPAANSIRGRPFPNSSLPSSLYRSARAAEEGYLHPSSRHGPRTWREPSKWDTSG
jgi:hypothetical protein